MRGCESFSDKMSGNVIKDITTQYEAGAEVQLGIQSKEICILQILILRGAMKRGCDGRGRGWLRSG